MTYGRNSLAQCVGSNRSHCTHWPTQDRNCGLPAPPPHHNQSSRTPCSSRSARSSHRGNQTRSTRASAQRVPAQSWTRTSPTHSPTARCSTKSRCHHSHRSSPHRRHFCRNTCPQDPCTCARHPGTQTAVDPRNSSRGTLQCKSPTMLPGTHSLQLYGTHPRHPPTCPSERCRA